MSDFSKKPETSRPLRRLLFCVLLSLVDYAVVQIELQNVACLAAETGGFAMDMLFPAPSTLMPVILWFALLVLRVKAPAPQGSAWADWVFSGIFSFALLVLHSVYLTGTCGTLAANRDCLILFAFSLCGLTLLLRNCLTWVREVCRSVAAYPLSLPGIWKKHPFLFPFAVIFLLWLPFAVLKYPAGMEFDSYYQLYQIMGYAPLTNHWPVSSAVIYGVCYSLGKAVFGSMSAGLFTLVVCQMLFCAACFAWSLVSMQRLRVKEPVLMITLFVYAAFSVFSRYCTSLNKDCWFTCALLVFLCFCAEYLFRVREFRLKDGIFLTLLGLFTGILRSNGPYILIIWAGMLLLFWLVKRDKLHIKLFVSILAAFLLCNCYLNVLLPALDIPGASIREALSIPFMQTARYVKYHGDEVTPEEREIIDSVLDYDSLAEVYDERLSDPVKGSYHGEGEDLVRYFGVWLRQGLRHPKVYIDATLTNICGFFYPGAIEREEGIYTVSAWEPVFDELSQEQHIVRFEKMEPYIRWVHWFENFPLFYVFSNVAVHVWILAYLFLSSVFRKKGPEFLVLIPSLVSVLVFVAGPTFTHNGFRYALPVVFLNLYLIGIFLRGSQENEA